MQHYAPHLRSVFEGYYTRFDLPSGASLAIIISSVPNAPERPHMVSLTYVPRDSSQIHQRELWVDEIRRVPTGPRHAFELQVPGIGVLRVHEDGTTEYDLRCAAFTLHATTTSVTPWSSRTSTPEGLLVHLPLPLHWHVHSLRSPGTFALSLPAASGLHALDTSGPATLHQEKNWARSFPSAHIWLQARSRDSSSVCLAGGAILGLQALLLGYRAPGLALDFRPPLALALRGRSPFMRLRVDWPSRSVALQLRDFAHRIVLNASAPRDSFFPLSSPFADGHRRNYLAQSFGATVEVTVWRATGWLGGAWELVRREVFDDAALEFGGAYYGEAGEGVDKGD